MRKHTIDFNMDYHESFCEHATYITIIQLLFCNICCVIQLGCVIQNGVTYTICVVVYNMCCVIQKCGDLYNMGCVVQCML